MQRPIICSKDGKYWDARGPLQPPPNPLMVELLLMWTPYPPPDNTLIGPAIMARRHNTLNYLADVKTADATAHVEVDFNPVGMTVNVRVTGTHSGVPYMAIFGNMIPISPGPPCEAKLLFSGDGITLMSAIVTVTFPPVT